MTMLSALGRLCYQAASGRPPSRRAVAALAKLHGYTLQRHWPFFRGASGDTLNLGYQDVLCLQWALNRNPSIWVVGAFDGLANDRLGNLVSTTDCRAIFIEPQPPAFRRLQQNLRNNPGVVLVNAAIDRQSGERSLYYIEPGVAGLPAWTEQLASFDRQHLVAHEDRVPGLSAHIRSMTVKTRSFQDLLDQYKTSSIDVLQVDAEGMDAQLLAWFPFEKLKPGVVCYEVAHMSSQDLADTRQRLTRHGYSLHPTESVMDEMAVLI